MDELLTPVASATLELPGRPASAPVARRFARELLDGQPEAQVDVVELLVSEVVTNAILHAGSACRLIIEVKPSGAVHVEVHDTGRAFASSGKDHPDEPNGRGLMLVDRLAHEWGHEPSRDGEAKRVWFRLAGAGADAQGR